MESSEPLGGVTLVKPDGTDPKTLNPVGTEGTQWTLSKTLETGDNGPLEFRLQYTDLAGNSGEEMTTTTDATSVKMDTVAIRVALPFFRMSRHFLKLVMA